MELRLGLAWTDGGLLERDSLEPQSRALANQEDHAQAPLIPGHQVRPAQLAFTFHPYWAQGGAAPWRGEAFVPRNRFCGVHRPGGGQPTVPPDPSVAAT